ncbi:MAG: hypothetical protein ACM3SQ_09125 [Betaproteobacteria bacterium]
MKLLSRVALALALAAGAACSSITPVAVNVGDQCFRCRRPILETRLAAEMVDSSRLAYKFRTTGCLAKYLVDHPSDTGTLFVTDFTSGKMMPTADATFVPVVLDPNTGESDYRAYRNKADADKAAQELHATALDWTTVLAKTRS